MSAITFDPSADWQIMDQLESVTLNVRAGDVYSGTVAISNAICRAIDKTDVAKFGNATLTWHLWATQFASVQVPKVRDMIARDDGTRWSILSVQIADVGTRFVCQTIQERS